MGEEVAISPAAQQQAWSLEDCESKKPVSRLEMMGTIRTQYGKAVAGWEQDDLFDARDILGRPSWNIICKRTL